MKWTDGERRAGKAPQGPWQINESSRRPPSEGAAKSRTLRTVVRRPFPARMENGCPPRAPRRASSSAGPAPADASRLLPLCRGARSADAENLSGSSRPAATTMSACQRVPRQGTPDPKQESSSCGSLAKIRVWTSAWDLWFAGVEPDTPFRAALPLRHEPESIRQGSQQGYVTRITLRLRPDQCRGQESNLRHRAPDDKDPRSSVSGKLERTIDCTRSATELPRCGAEARLAEG